MLIPSVAMRIPASPQSRSGCIHADLTLVPPGGVGQLAQMLSVNAALELTAFAVVGSVALLLRPDSDSELDSDESLEERAMMAICRPDGWLARCEITGERSLANALQPRQAVGLDVPLAFAKGSANRCTLLRPSRILEPSGRWRSDEEKLEWRIKCRVSIRNGGVTLVPAGTPLYFAATLSYASADGEEAARRVAALRGVEDPVGMQLTDGTVSVLTGGGPWGPELNLAAGTAQLVQVGTFEASAAAPAAGVAVPE